MLSAVIPVFNEAESLPALYGELAQVATDNGYELEIVFVDDGSTDGSWDEIEKLAAHDARVRGIRFRRNFGKAAALAAGFSAAATPAARFERIWACRSPSAATLSRMVCTALDDPRSDGVTFVSLSPILVDPRTMEITPWLAGFLRSPSSCR